MAGQLAALQPSELAGVAWAFAAIKLPDDALLAAVTDLPGRPGEGLGVWLALQGCISGLLVVLVGYTSTNVFSAALVHWRFRRQVLCSPVPP